MHVDAVGSRESASSGLCDVCHPTEKTLRKCAGSQRACVYVCELETIRSTGLPPNVFPQIVCERGSLECNEGKCSQVEGAEGQVPESGSGGQNRRQPFVYKRTGGARESPREEAASNLSRT